MVEGMKGLKGKALVCELLGKPGTSCRRGCRQKGLQAVGPKEVHGDGRGHVGRGGEGGRGRWDVG